jgi:hypothetical protein
MILAAIAHERRNCVVFQTTVAWPFLFEEHLHKYSLPMPLEAQYSPEALSPMGLRSPCYVSTVAASEQQYLVYHIQDT